MIDQLQEGKAKRERERKIVERVRVSKRNQERACEDMETTDVGKGWSK